MEIQAYFNMALLVGSAIALLMSIFFFYNPTKMVSNWVLGTITFFWSFTVFIFAIQSRSFFMQYPHIFGLASVMVTMFFPLLYIYIKSYLLKFKWSIAGVVVHLIPMLVYFISLSPFIFSSTATKIEYFRTGVPEFVNTVDNVFNIVVIAQGIFYTLISMQMLQGYTISQNKKFKQHQTFVINWLKYFLVAYVFLWAIGATGAVLSAMRFPVPFDLFNFFYLGLTILTLNLGYFALKRPGIFINKIIPATKTNNDLSVLEAINSNEEVWKDVQLMLDYMENEKAYLNQELSMQNLVEGIGLTKHRISEILNSTLDKTFYDMVNEYRVVEAIRLIGEGKHKDYTLNHLAEISGFNSKATFYRSFKKITDKTPTEFIDSIPNISSFIEHN